MDFSTVFFRPIQMEDRAWMEQCAQLNPPVFTALTFPSLMTWASTYRLFIGGDKDFFVVRSQHDKGYYMPCGDPEKCLGFMEHMAKKENPARFVYVPENITKTLSERGWAIRYRGDLSEYILSTRALALKTAHPVTHSYKNKVRHFASQYPYRAREIGPEDKPLLRHIRDNSEAFANPAGVSDEDVLSCEIENFEKLGFRGVLLETEEGPIGFFMGYPQHPGVFTATMVRRKTGLPQDALAVCLHELSRILLPDYPRINIEEDLGLSGLRTEKTLYSPVDLLKVYEAIK